MPAPAIRAQLGTLFSAAVDAVQPASLIQRTVTLDKTSLTVRTGAKTSTFPMTGKVLLVGVGKGAGPMAEAFLPLLGQHLTGGVVIVPKGTELPLDPVATVGGEHPLPGPGSLQAGAQLSSILVGRHPLDLVCWCLTGGASSLLVHPVPGVSLEDKLAVNHLLLACGAEIHEVNTVRKHLSQLKGGNLARLASPATVVGFILSDVIGDDLSTIGSGPTVPDPTTFSDAWKVLETYDLLQSIPESVKTHLSQGCRGVIADTPKPQDQVFSRVHNFLIGSNSLALEAAASAARQLGYTPQRIAEPVSGDTTTAARAFAQQMKADVLAAREPICLLAGGETTVQLTGKGQGGRNQEFALIVAEELQNEGGWTLLSAGTDGIDGPTDAAGAFVDGDSIRRAREKGFDPPAVLKDNDTYPFFSALGDLFQPGPTGTNVMDIKIVLIAPSER